MYSSTIWYVYGRYEKAPGCKGKEGKEPSLQFLTMDMAISHNIVLYTDYDLFPIHPPDEGNPIIIVTSCHVMSWLHLRS